MIDTIILSIPKTKVMSLDFTDDKIQPWSLQASTNVYDKYVKNPYRKGAKQSEYYPRLTETRRKGENGEWTSTIKIEFSAPKLLYQNNLDELIEDQFEQVIKTLSEQTTKLSNTNTFANIFSSF